MLAATAAIVRMPMPTAQNHGVFAALRSTCEGSLGGRFCAALDVTTVGALPIPEGPPIMVAAADGNTTVAASGGITPLAVGMPWRDPESRRRRLRSAPMSAAVW